MHGKSWMLAAGIGATGVAAITAAVLVLSQGARNAAPAPAPTGRPLYTGLNLGAGGFAAGAASRYGFTYAYPTATEAKPFLAAGMNTVRVPFLWKRVQRKPFGELDPVEMKRLDGSLDGLSGFKLIILDVHDYGRWNGRRLDQVPDGSAMLADLWTRLARRYGGRNQFAFGIMNEPHDLPAAAWRDIASASLRAIRATGARNLVLVPGTRWTAAHRWTEGGPDSNAAAFEGFTDPARNMAYEMHLYLDRNSSGTGKTCVSPQTASDRLTEATEWLERSGSRGFLGEFGVPADSNCLAGLEELLRAMDAKPQTWVGWTYWAGGTWWGVYPFSIQPDASGHRPQMAVLKRHLSPQR